MDNRRIIIVEDEVILAEDIKDLLHSFGFTVPAIVTTSKGLFETLKSCTADLLLMDVMLRDSKLDGIAIAEKVRTRYDLPIVYLTAYADDETIQRAKLTEPFGYLIKPFEERELLTTIEMALYKHQMESERKRAESAILESESRFRTLFESSPDAIFVCTPDGKIIDCNPMASALCNQRKEKMTKMHLLDLVKPDQVQIARDDFDKLNAGKTDLLQTRFMAGKARPHVEIRLSHFSFSGQSARLLHVRDITERKMLQEQLLHSQKMEAVGRLAGGIAHDFNNLLMGILGYSEHVLGQLSPNDPLTEYIIEIDKAGERAVGLTRQLLAFSRKQETETAIIDINDVVREMKRLLRRVTGENIRLRTRLRAKGSVRIDPVHLGQAIMNLVINARDAMPNGGELVISTSNKSLSDGDEVDRLHVHPGKYMVICIRDNGTGMDQETRVRAFEPYFTTKEKGKRTGLGLSMTYGTIVQNQGRIELESEKNKGTSCFIYLPLFSSDRVQVSSERKEAIDFPGQETILLVEDDSVVRKFAATILRENGFRVLEAKTPVEAQVLGKRYEQMIDLLITDVVLPEMSGSMLADNLKSGSPDLKVIFMSGYSDRAISLLTKRGLFLQKPFKAPVLMKAIQQVLSH